MLYEQYAPLHIQTYTAAIWASSEIFLWYGTYQRTKFFINEIIKKHHFINLDFKFRKKKIAFLDTLVYKDFVKKTISAKRL